ncbi:MAG: hypothetical protein ACM33T_08685 [Solirubrobacterales bacterium]
MVTIPPFPLLALGAVSLVIGVLTGEARMGWEVPAADLMLHGPLMVSGFFGTVIGLERAVALGRKWGYLAPLLTGAGGVALAAGLPATPLLVFGSLVFLAMALVVVRRQPEVFTAVMALGAVAWVAGNAAWFHGATIPRVVPLWACFLVLTIAGERLELSRFLPPRRHRVPTLLAPLTLVLAGAAFASPLAFGLGLVLLFAWSLANDVVRRTIRQGGLTRYVAVCLLSGYGWLALSGLLMPFAEGWLYDAALHALFVGFVFAMVFGHAPVILPAVVKIKIAYGRHFYAPLALLHGGLIVRVAGDLLAMDELRRCGGLLNGIALAAFIATMVAAALRAKAGAKGKPGAAPSPAA